MAYNWNKGKQWEIFTTSYQNFILDIDNFIEKITKLHHLLKNVQRAAVTAPPVNAPSKKEPMLLLFSTFCTSLIFDSSGFSDNIMVRSVYLPFLGLATSVLYSSSFSLTGNAKLTVFLWWFSLMKFLSFTSDSKGVMR